MKVWCAVAVLLVAGCAFGQEGALKPMAKEAHPVFEVATIKPSDPMDRSSGFQQRGRHIKVRNKSVLRMVMFAYGLHEKQIVGGPAWMNEHFDVDGVPDVDGYPNLKQMQEMVARLLVDRFGLKVHHERREMSVYALTVDKSGVKMTPTKSGPDDLPDDNSNGNGSVTTETFVNHSMDVLAMSLQMEFDKPLVNQTGLPGRYDFVLKWNPKLVPEAESDVPGLFTAVREQLGLKIEATKGMVDVTVIDGLVKPSEN